MSTSQQDMTAYAGPAILSCAFRPLFLAAAAWAALAMALWSLAWSGTVVLPTAFGAIDWHVHELLYGYAPAVIAGFLLTAIPSWTGRPPVTGAPLLLLTLCWIAGRAAVLAPARLGPVAVALVDVSFLAALAAVVARELVAGRNWRNLKVLVVIAALFAGNAVFHAEAASGTAFNGYGARLGIGAVVFLIMLIGGRIVPAFTRNWLAARRPGRLPMPFGRFDAVAVATSAAALAVWVARPESAVTAALCFIAGGLQAWRLARWAGERTLHEGLVLILHLGYAFVPIGFLLVGCTVLAPDLVAPGASVHAWTAGAMGVMTLAVMTRASLGHAGRALNASFGTVVLYACAIASAVLRIAAGSGAGTAFLVELSALLWIVAFGGFAVLFGPMLVQARQR